MIIACDHPARGALRVGDRPMAMANRVDLLDRLRPALSRPGVNGLLGSPDIIEDLLLLGALEGKVVFGSMNRGGLQGRRSRSTTSSPATTPTPSPPPASTAARPCCASTPRTRPPSDLGVLRAGVNELADHRLMAMVEPFFSHRVDGKVRNDLSADAMIKAMTVSAGLGRTSAYTWIKLPVVPEMERVMAATTLPSLILGGEVSTDPEDTFAAWRDALALPTVLGLVVGRTLLYPPDDDVAAAVDTAVGLL